jgi:hypothetical protein
LTYNGEESIKTIIGGLVSIFLGIGILIYFLYRFNLVTTRGDNKLYEVSFIKSLDEDGPFLLQDSQFKIFAQMIDPEFNNDDNEYIKFKMSMHTSYETEEEVKIDIPLAPCTDIELINPKLIEEWYYG